MNRPVAAGTSRVGPPCCRDRADLLLSTFLVLSFFRLALADSERLLRPIANGSRTLDRGRCSPERAPELVLLGTRCPCRVAAKLPGTALAKQSTTPDGRLAEPARRPGPSENAKSCKARVAASSPTVVTINLPPSLFLGCVEAFPMPFSGFSPGLLHWLAVGLGHATVLKEPRLKSLPFSKVYGMIASKSIEFDGASATPPPTTGIKAYVWTCNSRFPVLQ